MRQTVAQKEKLLQSWLRSVATIAKTIANRQQPAPSFPASWWLRRSRHRFGRMSASVIRFYAPSLRLQPPKAKNANHNSPDNPLINKGIHISEALYSARNFS